MLSFRLFATLFLPYRTISLSLSHLSYLYLSIYIPLPCKNAKLILRECNSHANIDAKTKTFVKAWLLHSELSVLSFIDFSSKIIATKRSFNTLLPSSFWFSVYTHTPILNCQHVDHNHLPNQIHDFLLRYWTLSSYWPSSCHPKISSKLVLLGSSFPLISTLTQFLDDPALFRFFNNTFGCPPAPPFTIYCPVVFIFGLFIESLNSSTSTSLSFVLISTILTLANIFRQLINFIKKPFCFFRYFFFLHGHFWLHCHHSFHYYIPFHYQYFHFLFEFHLSGVFHTFFFPS